MSESAVNRAQHAQRIFEKAVIAHRAGQLDEAIAGYVRTLDIDSDYSQALNNMGVALRAQGAFPCRGGKLPPRHRAQSGRSG
jgi:Flp pilus assembly protein TadD